MKAWQSAQNSNISQPDQRQDKSPMWILTCDGDLFGHKPIWLRPGSTHLLGRTTARTENRECLRYIDHKGVSRKHFLIEIGAVKPGDSAHVHTRSKITVTDNSKTGTTINGERIDKAQRVLDHSEYDFKLGSYEHVFHLKWQPVVLTFVNLKGKGDALAQYRQTLEQTDVKLVTDYLSNTTTHVVAKKRNTTQCLQALAQAKWTVSYDFVDSLAAAAIRAGVDANGDPAISQLEKDFVANWPSEEQSVVPAGSEPVVRPDEYLKPNAERSEIFTGFTFIFMVQSQFENLLPVVTSCGGKALLRAVVPEEASVDEFVAYVKSVAGFKETGKIHLTQQNEKGSIVVVQQRSDDTWWEAFDARVQATLGQRSIPQNELLDIILTLDRKSICKPFAGSLEDTTNDAESLAQDPGQRPNSAAASPSSIIGQLPPSAQPARPSSCEQAIASSARKKPRRVITQSRFKGFDDFDPSQVTLPAPGSPDPDAREHSQASDEDGTGVNEQSQDLHSQRASRKRPAPVEDLEDEEAAMDKLLPGMAAMKRRKTEAQGRKGTKGSEEISGDEQQESAAAEASTKKRGSKQIDVQAELHARRERAEEQRRKDEDALREQMAGIDLSQLKNLAKVEEFDLPVRDAPSRNMAGRGNASDRWDPAWNGRRDFKKFRPQGKRRAETRPQRVIITLEEVPRKGHGLGEEYWLTPASSSAKSKSQDQTRSQARIVEDSDDNADPPRFHRRPRNPPHDTQDVNQEPPDQGASRSTRSTGSGQTQDQVISQTMATESQRKAAGKRPATEQMGRSAKQPRQSRVASTVDLDDDDDDDNLKFRRKRR